MFEFDIRGNLRKDASAIIPSDLEEMRATFVEAIPTDARLGNYERYLRYSRDLKNLLDGQPLKQWINGSFISRKQKPKDVDMVTFIDHEIIQRLGHALDDFRTPRSWEIYEVDAYIIDVYKEGSVSFKRCTELDMKYWITEFGETKRNRRGEKFQKAFLEIYY